MSLAQLQPQIVFYFAVFRRFFLSGNTVWIPEVQALFAGLIKIFYLRIWCQLLEHSYLSWARSSLWSSWTDSRESSGYTGGERGSASMLLISEFRYQTQTRLDLNMKCGLNKIKNTHLFVLKSLDDFHPWTFHPCMPRWEQDRGN